MMNAQEPTAIILGMVEQRIADANSGTQKLATDYNHFDERLNLLTTTFDSAARISEATRDLVRCAAEAWVVIHEFDKEISLAYLAADTSLRRLELQLPTVERQLDRAEARLDRMLDRLERIDPATCHERDLDYRDRLLDIAQTLLHQIGDMQTRLLSL